MVREGYVFRNGWITPDQAVVVILRIRARSPAGTRPAGAGARLPRGGAGREPLGRGRRLEGMEVLEGLPRTTYKRSVRIRVGGSEREDVRHRACRVPDAGWPTLRDFLQGTKNHLTVGVYNFTAPHIIDGVSEAASRSPASCRSSCRHKTLSGPAKQNDIPKRRRSDATRRNSVAIASTSRGVRRGKDHQFATATTSRSRSGTERRSGCRAATGSRPISRTTASRSVKPPGTC